MPIALCFKALLAINMKPLLAIIFLFGLLSCTNRKHKSEVKEKVKKDTSIVIQSPEKMTGNRESPDSFPSFDYDLKVYDEYLPAHLKSYINKNLPQWKLPDPSEWDNLWFQSYKSPNSLVNYIRGDFNCDQKEDYGLLLSDKTNSIAAWIIHSDENGYSGVKLEDIGTFDNHIQVGLELVEAGDLNYIDPDIEDEPKPIRLKCPAVQVVYFEKGAATYYWDNGKYNSVITGD